MTVGVIEQQVSLSPREPWFSGSLKVELSTTPRMVPSVIGTGRPDTAFGIMKVPKKGTDLLVTPT